MEKKYKRKRYSRFAEFFKEYRKPLMLLIIVSIAAIAAGSIIYRAAERQEFGSSFLKENDVIKIGLRTNVQGFGQLSEEGVPEGFDRDYIDAMMTSLLGGEEKVYAYYPITSQDAAGEIKYGNIDIALGLLSNGANLSKTQGFTLTDPYYTDQAVVVTNADSRAQQLSDIQSDRIGILNLAMSADDFKDYLSEEGLEFDLARYADYESAMNDLQSGAIDGVVMPRAISRQFEEAEFRILATPLYDIGYCIMLPSGQSAVQSEMNEIIRQLKENGTADALAEKWGLN